MKKYRILGVMSGTSLDGLDLAVCEFQKQGDTWQAQICEAVTIPYSNDWKQKLWQAFNYGGLDLCRLDFEYGHYIGNAVKQFCKKCKTKVDFVASHGHTVFHRPAEGLSLQIGHGAAIAASSGYTVVSDFRSLDIALGGHGAPLVPMADASLFSNYDYCLNLGGFANVSYSWYRHRIAFDICPVNFAINALAKKLDMEIDFNGNAARQGGINNEILKKLNKLEYYSIDAPKSLGREWVEHFFTPILEASNASVHDKLRTVYEHIAIQISKVFSGSHSKKVLVTGGGALNTYLIELITNKSGAQIYVPERKLVEYKEALAFAYLGLLRLRSENNCLASVTGAKHDCIGGAVYRM